jgi:hypothetical protein
MVSLKNESEESEGPLSAFVAKAANSALLGYAPEIYAGGKQIYEDIKRFCLEELLQDKKCL